MADVSPDRSGQRHTPTPMLSGCQDRATPPWQQRWVSEVLPNARLEIVEDFGQVETGTGSCAHGA